MADCVRNPHKTYQLYVGTYNIKYKKRNVNLIVVDVWEFAITLYPQRRFT